MDLTWDGTTRAEDKSEDVESTGTAEVGPAAQEMICGGAMIARDEEEKNDDHLFKSPFGNVLAVACDLGLLYKQFSLVTSMR